MKETLKKNVGKVNGSQENKDEKRKTHRENIETIV